VRGYEYRTLGPIVDGVVTSGRVMATGSIEIARPVSSRQPNLWVAAFFDAGQAAQDWRDLDPVYGYGVGMRFRSPAGAMRVDLAYGEAVRAWRLHVSLGVVF
jgi:translocation and assembly module TamA